jgi:hypothetical protein
MTYQRYENDVPTSYDTREHRDKQSDVSELRGEMPNTPDGTRTEREPEENEPEAAASKTDASRKGEASGIFKTVVESIERNPIPLAMIAGGVGFLVYNELRARKSYARPTTMRERVDASLRDEATTSAPGAISRVQHLAQDVGNEVGAVAGRASHAARELAHDATSFASQAASAAREAAHKGQDILLERPLVLAGLGLALGAAVAGTAPLSRREQQLLSGPASEAIDTLVHGAQQLKERAKDSAGALGEAAKREASVLMSSTEQVGADADREEPA